MHNQFHSHFNRQHLQSQTDNQPTLRQSLQNLCKAASTFMVLHPQAASLLPTISPEQRYAAKAGLYPYLPEGEEQRDWLDHVY